jgi:subtilisin family serine protease
LPEYETNDWGDKIIGEILGPIIGVKKRGVVTGFDKQLPLERDLNKRSERVLSGSQLDEAGIYAENALVNFDTAVPQCTIPINFLTQDADITDALAEGIIIVAAAGNESQYIDVPTGPDYNNKMYFEYYGEIQEYPYHQGTAPGSVPGVICVGAIDADFVEWKAWYSNTGPRIDIYAPGSQVTSAFLKAGSGWSDVTEDRRSNIHYIARDSGTSMASPQVCGVIACLLEKYPNMTPADALNYIITTSGKNEFIDQLTNYPNWVPGTVPVNASLVPRTHHAQGGPNRYLHFNTDETTYDGLVWPRKNHWLRPASGRTYPRSRIRPRG